MWDGTDVLKMLIYPPGDFLWHVRIFFERIFWHLADNIIWRHIVVSENLRDELIEAGFDESKIRVRHDPYLGDLTPSETNPYIPKHVEKVKHDSFNVAYFRPRARRNQRFKDWVYGVDRIERLKSSCPTFNWIELDGTQDMNEVYRTMDLYIRLNRHDGLPRMIEECKYHNIPYIWRVWR